MATYQYENGTFNLPDEGTTFRAIGDQGDAIYQVKDGQLSTLYSPSYIANTSFKDTATGISYKAGDTSTNPHDVQWLDPNYRGTATSRVDAFNLYNRATGLDASALPEFNMADIQTVLGRTGGVLPKVSATQTVDPNNPNAAVVTSDGKVVSPTAPAPQPGAITPTAGYTNPNQAMVTPTQPQQQAQQTPQVDPALVNKNVAPGTQPTATQQQLGINGQPQVNQPAAQVAVSSYTGPSIVDYLNSVGQPSDYASRARLAAQMGISNYSGTADQNTKLLNTLRMGQGTGAPQVAHNAPPELPSSNVNTNLLSKYGVNAPDASQSPMLSFVDSFKQILSQFGVPVIKKQFDSVQKEYDTLQNELNDKISDINDDPWLSEGVRQGRIGKLKERYEGKTSILTNKLKLYDSLYKQGMDEAKWVAGQAYQQYQFDQTQQLKLYEIAQDQLDAQNKFTEVSPGATLYDPNTGKAIYTAPTTASQNGTTGGSSTRGTVYSGGLTYTPSSQSSDSQVLESSRGSDGYVDPTVYLNLYKAWVQHGGILKDFLSTYPPKNYVNPANSWLPSYLKPAGNSLQSQIDSLF